MSLDTLLTPQDREFRAEVRDFCVRNVPAATALRVALGLPLDKGEYVQWQRALAERGWLTPRWPVADGGTDWSVVRHFLFEEELARANAPPVALTLAVGPRLVGPILCEFGTPAQKARMLPSIRDASVWWCQGYSETEAGSDLARLRTRATPVAGGWRLRGAKCWTSYAHWADRMACLARTADTEKPQQGLSLMSVDMRAPGVSVRPLRGANGRHFFNEVRLDDVFVADEDLIGPLNAGWRLAKTLLEHERLNAARVAETRNQLDRAGGLLQALNGRGRSSSSAALAQRFGELEADHRALEALVIAHVARAAQGHSVGPSASLLKLRGSELLQAVMDLLTDILSLETSWGSPPTADADRAFENQAAHAFYVRGFTIAAGTSEIQRSVLARQVLRLPPP
jgi:alkylation response protein AidB-like acyl-CoA dehydrogenase